MTAPPSRQVRLAREFCLGGWQLADRPIVQAEPFQPHIRVLAAIAPRNPASASDSKIHLSSCFTELFSDLSAGLCTPNHQHGPWQELLRIAVGVRMNLPDI